MKKILTKIIVLILCTQSFLWAMEQPSRSKAEQDKISACIAQISADYVPESVVKRAIFSRDNTFEIGETVIVHDHSINPRYLYGCITKISPIVAVAGSTLDIFIFGEKFSVTVFRKKWMTDSHLFGSNVGKILPASPGALVDLSVDAIVQQIRSGRLTLQSIKPQLPQEVYEKVIKALPKQQ